MGAPSYRVKRERIITRYANVLTGFRRGAIEGWGAYTQRAEGIVRRFIKDWEKIGRIK